MADLGASLAAEFLDRCRRRGLRPDATLRLLGHARDGALEVPPTEADRTLGQLHELLASTEQRRTRGAWYTPAWLARDLVQRVVDRPMRVADPACGGGVFLLAAADRLVDRGADPRQVVGELLWGADIDPLAVAIAEAELWLWSAGHGMPAVAGDRLVAGDALVEIAIPPVDVVVGNPPFLGQLKSATAHDAGRRRALTGRWGPVVRPYTDASWLFLVAAVDAVADGGAVTLVMPQSVLAARDAGAVRDRVDERAELVDCWIDDGSAFDAGVDVCAPLLRRRDGSGSSNDWMAAIGGAHGIPAVSLVGAGTVAERATVVAGFRDEYYGLVDAVVEGGTGRALITSGAIDPFRTVAAPIRFAKRRWEHPTVDHARATGRAARWLEVQAGPKLVVASQTRVLEAVVDVDGSLVAGVPALVVRPHEVADLWHLAAALHAPAVSAWMLRRAAGTALSAGACRPTAALVAEVPLPSDTDAWDRATALARELAAGADVWESFAVAADASYEIDDTGLRDWWLGRLPLR